MWGQAALLLLAATSSSLLSLASSQGGVVTLDPCRETTLSYKFNQNYTNNELGIWVFTSVANNLGPVNITIETQGFEANYDGLTAYSFDTSITSVQNCTL